MRSRNHNEKRGFTAHFRKLDVKNGEQVPYANSLLRMLEIMNVLVAVQKARKAELDEMRSARKRCRSTGKFKIK